MVVLQNDALIESDSLPEFLDESGLSAWDFYSSLPTDVRAGVHSFLPVPYFSRENVLGICHEAGPSRKVLAIKTVRETFCIGLRDAKSWVDAVWHEIQSEPRGNESEVLKAALLKAAPGLSWSNNVGAGLQATFKNHELVIPINGAGDPDRVSLGGYTWNSPEDAGFINQLHGIALGAWMRLMAS